MVTNSCLEVSYLDNSRQIWTRLDTGFARIFASVSWPRFPRGYHEQSSNIDPRPYRAVEEWRASRPRSPGPFHHRRWRCKKAVALQARCRVHKEDRRTDPWGLPGLSDRRSTRMRSDDNRGGEGVVRTVRSRWTQISTNKKNITL